MNEYAKGARSYDRLKGILVNGEIISPHFEKGYRPLLHSLPELNERTENFRVHCYEKFDVYDEWVLSRDELVVQMLTSENLDRLEDFHHALIQETERRNKVIAQRIGEISSSSRFDLYVVMGRLHAPQVVDRLREDFDVEEVVLEDLCMTPLDESIILTLQGKRLGPKGQVNLQKHRELAREAMRRKVDIMKLLRDHEIIEEYGLKRYSSLHE